MAKQNKKKWNDSFNLTLSEDRTHRKIRSLRFTRLGFTVFIVTAVVALLVGFYALLAYTPLRSTIPGYPDARARKAAVDNAVKIDSLENVIARWHLYAGNLSQVLSGKEPVNSEAVQKGSVSEYLSDKAEAELARQDSLLRAKVVEEEQFTISAGQDRKLPITGLHFFCPAKGVVSRGFELVLHQGVDVTAPAGTMVCSVLDGTVIFDGIDEEGCYNLLIQHDGDITSSYKHIRKLLRSQGDKVKAGTAVGLLGGLSGGAGEYLHFELWYKGEAVDPALYISF